MVKTCPKCQQLFETEIEQKKFCSKRCKHAASNSKNYYTYRVPAPAKSCLHCGATTPDAKHKFCSEDCKRRHGYEKHRVSILDRLKRKYYASKKPKPCLWCGVDYIPDRERPVYCSDKCSDLGRSEAHSATDSRRRSRVAGAEHGMTRAEWDRVIADFGGKCAYCGKYLEKAHRDHFVPVARGGGYTKSNVVPVCQSCNSSKRDRMPLDWLVQKEHGLVTYARIALYLEKP